MHKPKIQFLVPHNRPHLDEWWAILAIKRWCKKQAEQIWPGSSTADLDFLRTGMLPGGTTWRDFPDKLFIGCAKGSPLDEHWSNLATETPECAATLAAKLLGVSDRVEFQNPLRHILNVDQGGTRNCRLVSAVLNLLYSMRNTPTIEGVMDWVDDACSVDLNDQVKRNGKDMGQLTIDRAHEMMKEQGGERSERADRWLDLAHQAMSERQRRFEAAKPVVQAVEPVSFDSVFGQVSMISVRDDNDQLVSAAFSLNKADVVICHRNNKSLAGTVQILTKAGRNICLSKVAALIRHTEMGMRNEPKPEDELDLYDVDVVPSEGRWHLMDTKGPHKRMLFNGSPSHPDVDSTIIPPDMLKWLVQRGLQKE